MQNSRVDTATLLNGERIVFLNFGLPEYRERSWKERLVSLPGDLCMHCLHHPEDLLVGGAMAAGGLFISAMAVSAAPMLLTPVVIYNPPSPLLASTLGLFWRIPAAAVSYGWRGAMALPALVWNNTTSLPGLIWNGATSLPAYAMTPITYAHSAMNSVIEPVWNLGASLLSYTGSSLFAALPDALQSVAAMGKAVLQPVAYLYSFSLVKMMFWGTVANKVCSTLSQLKQKPDESYLRKGLRLCGHLPLRALVGFYYNPVMTAIGYAASWLIPASPPPSLQPPVNNKQ